MALSESEILRCNESVEVSNCLQTLSKVHNGDTIFGTMKEIQWFWSAYQKLIEASNLPTKDLLVLALDEQNNYQKYLDEVYNTTKWHILTMFKLHSIITFSVIGGYYFLFPIVVSEEQYSMKADKNAKLQKL